MTITTLTPVPVQLDSQESTVNVSGSLSDVLFEWQVEHHVSRFQAKMAHNDSSTCRRKETVI